MIDPVSQGAIAAYLLLAGLLTLVAGAVLLALYRRAVRRWMGLAGPPPVAVPLAALAATAGPALPLADASDRPAPHRFRSATFSGAVGAFRRAAIVYALAGFAHAATATALQILFGQFEFLPIRASVVFWANAWPVTLTLVLLWGADRRRQALTVIAHFVVLAALALTVALGPTPPLALSAVPSLGTPEPGLEGLARAAEGIVVPPFAQPLLVWLMYALPTAYLLLFLNRHVRSIGPLLLVFMVIAATGAHLATVALSARPEWFAAASMLTGAPVELWVYGFPLLGMIVFAVPGWLVIRWIGRRYQRKQFSDQSFVFDGIWLFSTLLLCQTLIQDVGYAGWAGLLAFLAWKLVCLAGLSPLVRRATARPPAQLLLLRVFGFQRRTQRLFSVLSTRWRYAGPIQLIAAPDLATANIEPGEFLDFLSGRLRRAFIRNEGDLDRRFAEIDRRPDPDGRYRVNEFFCAGDIWRRAVVRLMGDAHLVAMDLRGFTPANQGCLFEIQTLAATVPAARTAFLVDKTTDLDLLRRALASAPPRLDASAPDAGAIQMPHLLPTGGPDRKAVRALLHLADEALAGSAAAAGGVRPAAASTVP